MLRRRRRSSKPLGVVTKDDCTNRDFEEALAEIVVEGDG